MDQPRDLFISYSSKNQDVAVMVVKKLEERGLKCFIAPRDIPSGTDYASALIGGITNSLATLLLFSSSANKSGYVLREVNCAISHDKTIIPLRIENFYPTEAMEFYLGVTHWLDAFPTVMDDDLDRVCQLVANIKEANQKETSLEKKYAITGPELIKVHDIGKINYDVKKVVIREVELDYLCIPTSTYNMNVDIEGTWDNWIDAFVEYENDTSALMVENDEIIGYCDMYPVKREAFENLISGREIIRKEMIDLFCFGGTFPVYIAMVAIEPNKANQQRFLMFFDWIFAHISEWANNGIHLSDIGASSYNPLLDKFLESFGFVYVGLNEAKGKIYQTDIQKLAANPLVIKRWGHLSI